MKRSRNLVCTLVLALLCLLVSKPLAAQFVIQYPNAAQGMTVSLNPSLLTVRVDVATTSSSNNTVMVALAPGLSYVSGSVAKTGGTSGLSILHIGGTASNPVFSIGPNTLSAGQYIIFTLQREAACGARTHALTGSSFKDAVTVSGSAGTSTESSPTINSYSVNYPSFSISPPDATNNTVNGGVYSRTFSITNGSDGCASAVYFYVLNPGAGITTNSVSLGGSPLTPTATNGDTLFYTVASTQLGPDQLFCNGESLVFTESFRVNTCDAATTYGTGWGPAYRPSNWCQVVNGVGTTNAAAGVPAFTSATGAQVGFTNMCTPFNLRVEYYNGGTGNASAATMYDITMVVGHYPVSILYPLNFNLFTFSNARVGSSNPASITISGGLVHVSINNLFTSDPDGAGVGIADIDGDGYYDDLPPGGTAVLTLGLQLNCNLSCGTDKTHHYTSATIKYRTMCSNAVITANGIGLPFAANYWYEGSFLGTGFAPANVVGGAPFRIRLSAGYYINNNSYATAGSRYRWKVVLPAGVTVAGSGNPTYGTSPVSYTQSGDTIIYVSSNNTLNSFNIDLKYTCGAGGNLTFNYTLEKVNDIVANCKCSGNLVCASISTNAFCATACANGPTTLIPTVRRVDGSLGWTNNTLTTRVSASAISAYDLAKALYLDTIQITGSMRQNGTYNNLYLELMLAKSGSTSKLTPENITVKVYRGGILMNSCTSTTFSQAASTSSMQAINWNLSACLPSGSIQHGDSVVTVSRYLVSTNNLPQYDVQSGHHWQYYNLNLSGNRDACNYSTPEMYLAGTHSTNANNGQYAFACNNSTLGGGTHYLSRRFGPSGLNYQSEFRPAMIVDSVVVDIPAGYEYVAANYNGIPMTPVAINGRVHRFINGGAWVPFSLTVTNTYGAIVPFTVRPTCSTQPSENLNSKIYIRDFYYAYAGRPTPPPGFSYEISGGPGRTQGIAYSDISKPEIAITDQTGLVQAASPQESWTFRMSGVSTYAAPYTWFAIQNNPNVTINQVVDLSTGLALTPISYAGGKWYQLSVAGIAPSQNKDYRIDFGYTSCGLDSIKVLAGWNCGSFPSSPDAYPCGGEELYLKYHPVSAELQIVPVVETTNPVDACTPFLYQYTLNSTQAGNVKNPSFSIDMPTGLFPAAFQAEYPAGAGNWSTISPSVSGNVYTYNLASHPAYPVAGIAGTLSAGSTADRQMTVRFNAETNCSFVANSALSVYASGTAPCGGLAIGSGASHAAPRVEIIQINQSYFTVNTASYNNVLSGTGSSTVVSASTIIVGGTTGNEGTIRIDLPLGLSYQAGSLACNSGPCPSWVSTTTLPGGRIRLVYAIPSGVNAGQSLNYHFTLLDNGNAGCGPDTLEINTFDQITNIPCPTAPSGACSILSFESSANGPNFLAIPNQSPSSAPTSISGTDHVCPGETVTLSVSGGTVGGGAAIEWFAGACGSAVIGTGASIVLNPTSTQTYYVRYRNSCNTTTCVSYTVNVLLGSTSASIATSSVSAVSACQDGPWTYYRNPSNASELVFAINWAPDGSLSVANAAAKASATVDVNVGSATAVTVNNYGTWVMGRYWNVNAPAFDEAVDIKFYFDPAEKTAIENAATSFAATHNADNEGFVWFKTISGPYNPANVSASGVDLNNTIPLTGTLGSENSVQYVQFTGLTSFSGGTGASGVGKGSALPIELLYFKGNKSGEENILTWATASEQNSDLFILERSQDGVQFSPIARLDAAGNTQSTLNYQHTDASPLGGTSYYRLQLLDQDGSVSYSQIISMDRPMQGTAPVNVSPNPAHDYLQLDLQAEAAGDIQLKVLDQYGRILMSQTKTIDSGANQIRLNISQLPTGVYHISMTSANAQTSLQRFVKD